MSKAEQNVRFNYATGKLGISELGPGSMSNLLMDHLDAIPNKPIMMSGEPGIGKTVITNNLANKGAYYILTIRLVNEDEGTMNGYADPDENGQTVTLRVVRKVKEAAEIAKAENKRLIIFFDEVNRAVDRMIKYVFNIIDTKRWGDYVLPADTSFIAAINPPTQNHKVRDILSDSALRRRFGLYAVKADCSEYLTYARKAKLHPTVIGFLSSNPRHIYDYTALDNGFPYACPASWDVVSDLMYWAIEKKGKRITSITKSVNITRMLEGAMGTAMTFDFLSYAEDMSKRFSPENILNNYKKDIQKEIKATVGSEFTEEDADLDLSKLTTIVTTLAGYVADQIFTKDMDFYVSDEDRKERNITAKDATKINKQGLNLAMFLFDCPSELFQTFYSTIKRTLKESSKGSESMMNDHLQKTNQLVNYKQYSEAANRYMDARK